MKKTHLLSACLLTFFFFLLGCRTLAKMNESADINRGWRFHRRGDYEWAISAFDLALRENPKSEGAYIGLALTWEDKGDFDRAKEYFSKAVALDPRNGFTYDVGSNKIESSNIRRGWRHHRWAEYDQAIASFNEALKKNPASAEAYNGLAVSFEDKGDYDQATRYLSKAIELHPKAGYFWLRGEVWRKKGDFAHAIEDYSNAIDVDPILVAAYVDRGSCYLNLGNYESALESYNKVLQLTSDDTRAYALRARKIALEAISDLKKQRSNF